MGKKYVIKISDNFDDYRREQQVWTDEKKGNIYYCVCNLNECPEDAIIGRNLFSAYEYIDSIIEGFNIAKHGYDEIVIEEVPWDDE